MSATNLSYCRRLITIIGTVQGVGFRPFLFRLATRLGVKGTVKNTNQGVLIDAEASSEVLTLFQQCIQDEKPQAAIIHSIDVCDLSPHYFNNFTIEKSTSDGSVRLPLLADRSLCTLCYEEMLDPNNRRHHYPFIHCTECGPRFTLTYKLPFDRENTAMHPFSLCSQCQREYNDPSDRRFFSQTICCPCCGPTLILYDNEGNTLCQDVDAIEKTKKLLAKEKIVAIKNSGGFLLLGDALSSAAAQRLRHSKRRPDKPMAVLAKDIDAAEKIAHISNEEKKLLLSTAAPIVLLRKKERYALSPHIAPSNGYIGVMLPSTGLLHLLMQGPCPYLIATSGNLSGMPLCINENQVQQQLGANIDAILTHNRAIFHSLDDSVAHVVAGKKQLIRRAKGFVPEAIALPKEREEACLIAAGAQQKSAFAFSTGSFLYLSQHIGDLGSKQILSHYSSTLQSWQTLLSVKPKAAITDMHESYDSSRYLKSTMASVFSAQHHLCHILSCMLDNRIFSPVLGIAWDGTGLGSDGTLWGAEAFILSQGNAKRVASFFPLELIGGEAAIKEPCRQAFAALWAAGLLQEHSHYVSEHFTTEEQQIFLHCLTKRVSTIECSSAGRLFDVVAALLGLCNKASFEGQGPLALEALAMKAPPIKEHYPYTFIRKDEIDIIDWRPMITKIASHIKENKAKESIAMQFHNTLAHIVCTIAMKHTMQDVLLTGGVMQNKVLSILCIEGLQKAGFIPYWHGSIPAGDGGIAAGQALYPLFIKAGS